MALSDDYPNLDDETIRLLTELTEGDPVDITSLSRNEARAMALEYLSMMAGSWTPPECSVIPIDLPGPASGLLIRPKSRPPAKAPLVIWFHGGGWIFGSAALHAAYGCEYAARANCLLAEVDYPLSPETRGQELIDICVASAREIIRRHQISAEGYFGIGVKKRPIILGGESAGATLALFVGLALGSDMVDKIVVANPLVDFRPGVDYPSRSKFDDARLMQSWPEFGWFIEQFAAEQDRRRLSVIVSPIRGMPKTSVVVGEYDMLLDEANACVDVISAAGFAAETIMIRGAIHNSIELGPNTAAGERFIAAISDRLSI